MTKGTDMNRMPEILDGLITKTEEGKLKWRAVIVGRTSFITSVDTISVIVREDFDKRRRLAILNDEGITVQVLQTPDRNERSKNDATPEQDIALKRLFDLAQDSALNPDSTLEKLAEVLASY